ncbi:MAG: ABC transporter permease [Verrucomicrobiales bacterium]
MRAGNEPLGVHRAFSPARVWAMTTNTFTQLVRMRVFYFLLIFSLVIVAISFLFAGIAFEEQLRLLKNVSFGSMRLFCGIFALVGTALLIPKDVEDRTLYTILSKPVPRLEYLLGKLFGVLLLIVISLVVMTALFTAVLHLRGSVMLNNTIENYEAQGHELDEEEIAYMEEGIREQGADWNLLNGVWAVFLEAAVAASVALLISTFASSTLFTIVVGLVIYLIGHLQALARGVLFEDGAAPGVFARLVAALISLVFPDFHQFSAVQEGMADGTAPAASLMWSLTGIAFFYLVIYNLIAYLMFSSKEL